jgi:hypothetical protein
VTDIARWNLDFVSSSEARTPDFQTLPPNSAEQKAGDAQLGDVSGD